MSATVLKLPRNPAAVAPADLSDTELADQIGEHDRQYALVRSMLDRRSELHDEAQTRCANKGAKEESLFEGSLWRVTVGEKGWRTVLPDMASIHRMFKTAKADFYAAVSITIKAMEEALGKEAVEKVKKKEQTGNRKITAVLKAEPKAS